MTECRHGRPECVCNINPHDHTCQFNLDSSTQPLSSGRWDAAGSWSDAVTAEQDKAFGWASGLSIHNLHWAITVMASDVNAFSLYERKALLEVVALRLGKEARGE
jgi:hypothetical protein